MTSFDIDPALLPAPGEAPRCAEPTGSRSIASACSALHVDEVLLIDVPQPWPKPVWAADGFTHVPEAVMVAGEQGRRVRALAAVPLDGKKVIRGKRQRVEVGNRRSRMGTDDVPTFEERDSGDSSQIV